MAATLDRYAAVQNTGCPSTSEAGTVSPASGSTLGVITPSTEGRSARSEVSSVISPESPLADGPRSSSRPANPDRSRDRAAATTAARVDADDRSSPPTPTAPVTQARTRWPRSDRTEASAPRAAVNRPEEPKVPANTFTSLIPAGTAPPGETQTASEPADRAQEARPPLACRESRKPPVVTTMSTAAKAAPRRTMNHRGLGSPLEAREPPPEPTAKRDRTDPRGMTTQPTPLGN